MVEARASGTDLTWSCWVERLKAPRDQVFGGVKVGGRMRGKAYLDRRLWSLLCNDRRRRPSRQAR